MDEVPESTIALPTRPPSLPPPAWLTSLSGTWLGLGLAHP